MKKILSAIIGSVVILIYFGQACSSNASDPATSTAANAQAAGVLTAGSQTVNDGAQIVVSATGGSTPYTYSIISGSGSLVSNIFTAPTADGTTYVMVTDSLGATAIATIVYSSATTTTTVSTATTAAILNTTFEDLGVYVSGCTQSNPMSGACAAGINRYCANNGFATGFGPLEFSGDSVYFTCTPSSASAVVTTSFSLLQSFNSGCAITNPHSDVCNSAASRLCVSQGYVSGFGPLEFSGDSASVGCVNSSASTQIPTSFSTLQTYDSDCSSDAPVSGACSAAVHRFCVDNNYAAAGFGPTEHSGDSFVLTCVQ